ncbi:MAG: efflux RND transporter periplasmic adaptor subunit [Bdellovibrionales bacterium]
MSRLKWALILVPLFILLGAGAWYGTTAQNRKYNRVKPAEGQITEAVYGLGKVKSNQRFEVKVGVLSTVKERFVREGDQVEKGQRLIQLESSAVFRAPFAGTVSLISLFEGETALPNSTILRLENLKDRYLELSLEQESALRIRPGQVAKVSFESLRNQTLAGQVTAIFPKDDEFIANIKVDNLDASILPGMTADVSVEIGQVKGTLVPYKALRSGTLLVNRKGHSRKIKVEVGLTDGLSAEITGGELLPDDEILVPKE